LHVFLKKMQKIFGGSKTNIYFCTRFWRKAAFRLFGIGCKAICFADFFNKFFPKILEIVSEVLPLQSVSQKSGVFLGCLFECGWPF